MTAESGSAETFARSIANLPRWSGQKGAHFDEKLTLVAVLHGSPGQPKRLK
jgi:hypothetical protein